MSEIPTARCDPEAELISRYELMVYRYAHFYRRRLANAVEFEDLCQYGRLGLLIQVRRRGKHCSMRRAIRNGIVDGLREELKLRTIDHSLRHEKSVGLMNRNPYIGIKARCLIPATEAAIDVRTLAWKTDLGGMKMSRYYRNALRKLAVN